MTRDKTPRDPHDEPEATQAEKKQAESFGRLVDDILTGQAPPPAMDPDQRMLVETATAIVASNRITLLDDDRTSRLVEQALEAAVTGSSLGKSSAPPTRNEAADDADSDLARQRQRRRATQVIPWAVAAVACAAAIVMFVMRPAAPSERQTATAQPPPAVKDIPVEQSSRPADALIGRIDRQDAARAGERMDVLFADRMAGYRSLALSGALAGSPPGPARGDTP